MDKLKALLKKLGAKDEDIESLVADLEADKEAEVAGLKRKNQELIARSKAAKDEGGGKVAELEDAIEDLKTNLAKVQRDADRAVKKAEADAKAAQDLAAVKSGALSKLIRDDGLTNALVAVGVKKELLPAATAYLRERVQVDEEKGEAFAMVKGADGKESRKALAEFAKDWAQGDEGKHYVSVPPSSGGGSQGPGSGQAPGAKSMTRAAFDGLPPAQKVTLSKEGVTLTD